MTKVNFFVVGAPRCATTSLYYALLEHPNICVPETKEPNYFCAQDAGFSDAGITQEWYFDQFKPKDSEMLLGDFSTSYFSSPSAPEAIYEHNPSARIIICVRDPFERARSHYDYQVAKGLESAKSFSEALALENQRRENGEKNWYWYRENSSYGKHVRRYIERFGENNVLIVDYELIAGQPDCVVSEILQFLELDQGNNDIQIGHHNRRMPFTKALVFRLTTPAMRRVLKSCLRFVLSLRKRPLERTPERSSQPASKSRTTDFDSKERREFFVSMQPDIEQFVSFTSNKNFESWLKEKK